MKSLTYFLAEQLSYTKIFEQAMRLKDFRDHFYGHFTQILQNWALITAAKLYDKNTITINHWKSELIEKCDEFIDAELKSGDKKKTLTNLILNIYEYDDPKNISKKISKKFAKEGFSKINVEEISNILADRMGEIINILSSDYADDWVENL